MDAVEAERLCTVRTSSTNSSTVHRSGSSGRSELPQPSWS